MLKRDVLNVQMHFVAIQNAHKMTKDVYDVKTYAEFAKKSFSWKYLESPTIEKILKNKVGKETKIIEAGCGEGRLIEFLISKGLAEENIVGIDLSQYLLDIGKEKFPKVTWIAGSIGDEIKEIKNGSTDWVISSMVLDYLDNKSFQGFLENCFKWLKKDGQILLVFPHPVRMVADLSKYFMRVAGTNRTPWGEMVPYNHRTVGDYINGVIKAGFEIKEVIEPELPKESINDDSDAYKRYSAGPMRLAIYAVKNG